MDLALELIDGFSHWGRMSPAIAADVTYDDQGLVDTALTNYGISYAMRIEPATNMYLYPATAVYETSVYTGHSRSRKPGCSTTLVRAENPA